MTPEQKNFLIDLLGQISIKASDVKAKENIDMIQSILHVLHE